MTPQHFLLICVAETSKLFSRFSARAGLVIAALLGMAGPLFLFMASAAGIEVNGQDVSQGLVLNGPVGLQWALEVRNNSQILRALILMLTALSVAGEYNARTIREDLVRPIPRWTLPLAKWFAMVVWIIASLLVAWVYGGVTSTIAYGPSGAWSAPFLGYAATVLADAGFAALALMIAVWSRSVAGTIAGVFVYLILDTVAGWALKLLGWASGLIELPDTLLFVVSMQPWLPSSAFSVWIGYAERADWDWRSFTSLAILTALCLVGAERFFHRVDVP